MISEIKSYDNAFRLSADERWDQAEVLFLAATAGYEALPPLKDIVSMDTAAIEKYRSVHLIWYRFGSQSAHGSALIHSHGQEIQISWSPNNLSVRVMSPTLETFQRIPPECLTKMGVKSSSGGIFNGSQVQYLLS